MVDSNMTVIDMLARRITWDSVFASLLDTIRQVEVEYEMN